jgi:group I intron endonuclease
MKIRRHYLYKITCQKNGKLYIGQALHPKKRWAKHKQSVLAPEITINYAMKKHGVDFFIFEIIASGIKECTCQPGILGICQNDMNEMEKEAIQQYNSMANNGYGYNVSLGGDNFPMPEPTKLKISESMKKHERTEEHCKNISLSKMGDKNPMFGKSHTAEHNKLISDALSGENNHFYGKTHSEETKIKMSVAKKGKTWKIIDGKRVWTLNDMEGK